MKNKHLFLLVSAIYTVLTGCQGNSDSAINSGFQLELPVFYVERPADALRNSDPRNNFVMTNVPAAERRAGNLWLKMPGQDPVNLTAQYTARQYDPMNPNTLIKDVGDVMSPSLNYDGTRLVFSMFIGAKQGNVTEAEQNHWDLWVYEIADPTNPNFTPYLHKLFNDDNVANSGNDLDPVFIPGPNGRVVFTSDRQFSLRQRFINFGFAASPYYDDLEREPALNLHIINGNGDTAPSSLRQLSTNMADERYPTVIEDGRIVFTRWELARDANKTTQWDLFSIYPDGSHLQMFYGAHSHTGGTANTVFSKPQQLPDGRLLTVMTSITNFNSNDLTTINQSNFGGGDLVAIDYKGWVSESTPRPNASQSQSAGQVSVSPGNVLSGPGLSLGGRYQSFTPIWQGSENGSTRLMVSWTPCRVASSINPPISYSTCDNGGNAAVDPVYGLHILDLDSGLFSGSVALVPADSKMVYVDPVVVTDRTKIFIGNRTAEPQQLTDHSGAYYDGGLALEGFNGVGAVHIRSVYDFDDSQAGLRARLGFTNNIASGVSVPFDLNALANPASTSPDDLPVRFVRLIAPIPSYPTDNNMFGYNFGVNGRNRRMRAILGYAPVQPDGSVYVKVPANVPFSFDLVDKNGNKLGNTGTNRMMHGNWLNVSVGEVLTCVGCHEGHSKTTPLNTGISDVSYSGVISLATQNNWDANMTSQLFGGETMALVLQRLATDQPTLVDADYAELHRDMVYKDYWSDATTFTPGTPIALEYNDRVYSTDADGNVLNQGLINTQVAPVIGPACAPVDFANPNDQPAWLVDSCMIVIDYAKHIQPMWEATRHVAYDTVTKTYTDGLCIDCHSTVNPVDGTAQVPMGISQLDLTQDGNGTRFIPNDETNRYLSYEEMVKSGNELTLDAMGNLVKVTQDVPDGMGGTVTVDVLIPGANLAIRTNREARNTRLLDILNNFRAGETVDHTIMMTDAEKRVLSEWIDLGLQYTNDRSNFPIQ